MRRAALLALIAALTLALSACGSGPGGGGAAVESVTITGAPASGQLEVGATADLDATVSATGGASTALSWSSSDEAKATVGADGVVTGVAEGTVTITATSAFDASKHDSVTLEIVATSADCDAPEEITGDIDQDRTLEDMNPGDCVDYRVTRDIAAKGVLTIEPGVKLAFDEDAGLSIERGGRIVAEGSADAPITFTGSVAQPGSWKGVQIWTGSLENTLDHVIIEYGGSGRWDYQDAGTEANLTLNTATGAAELNFTNSTLRHSANYGFYATEGAVFNAFDGNTITENEVAGKIHVNSVGYLNDSDPDNGAASSFSGNALDAVEVFDTRVYRSQTWADLGVPYRILDTVYVNGYPNPLTLTIEAGATLEFAEDKGISTENDGSLSARGTADDPITFTGVVKQAGSWKGVQIWSSSASNVLDHVVIEYGGSSAWDYHNSGVEANLMLNGVTNATSVTLTNSTVRASGNHGIYADEDAVFSAFEGNTITGNQASPVKLDVDSAGYLSGAGNAFGGNALDAIELYGSTVSRSQTWANPGVPYRVLDTFYVNGYPDPIHLAVEPGATFEFAEGKGVSTENDGSLSAVGTAEAPVTFTGVVQQPGSWKGVAFWSDSADNVLEHVIIEYGGSAHWNYQSDGTEANLTLNATTNDVSLTLRDSTLRQSGNWGIYIDDGGVLRDCANVLNADGGNRSSCPYP